MDPGDTPREVQYLAFIDDYTKIHGVPPAEADMQRYFRVTPPAVHEMVKTLERQGYIAREPGRPRSIRLLLSQAELPDLEWDGCPAATSPRAAQDLSSRPYLTSTGRGS